MFAFHILQNNLINFCKLYLCILIHQLFGSNLVCLLCIGQNKFIWALILLKQKGYFMYLCVLGNRGLLSVGAFVNLPCSTYILQKQVPTDFFFCQWCSELLCYYTAGPCIAMAIALTTWEKERLIANVCTENNPLYLVLMQTIFM